MLFMYTSLYTIQDRYSFHFWFLEKENDYWRTIPRKRKSYYMLTNGCYKAHDSQGQIITKELRN